MEQIVEARLEKEFEKTEHLTGRVHSQFRQVTNICFDVPGGLPRLITILTPRYTGIPDSLVVSEKYFSKLALLPVGEAVTKNRFSFAFETVAEPLTGTPDCRRTSHMAQHINFRRNNLTQKNIGSFLKVLTSFLTDHEDGYFNSENSGGTNIAEEHKAKVMLLLRSFCNALIAEDIEMAVSILPRCVGAGSGLTPSSDDALVGIMAAVTAAKLFETSQEYGYTFLYDNKEALMKSIDGKTTDVSLKYLLCAFEGRFSDALLDLICALFAKNESEWDPILKAVASVGGTSGMDMLSGIEIGCQILRQHIV